MKKITLLLLFVLCSAMVFAQDKTETVAMDSGWITDGKMYVVLLCVLILLGILLLFLFSMDKKLKKIEKNLSQQK